MSVCEPQEERKKGKKTSANLGAREALDVRGDPVFHMSNVVFTQQLVNVLGRVCFPA